MPAALRTPRERWIVEASAVMAEAGVDAVRVEVLAARLGVSKGGFYAHFSNRDQLLAEVLDEWERTAVSSVLEQVDGQADGTELSEGAAIRQITAAGSLTFAEEILPLELAIRSWSRRDARVFDRLRRVDNARMDFLRSRFGVLIEDPGEIEARSVLAYTLAIAAHFLAADLVGSSRETVMNSAGELVLHLG